MLNADGYFDGNTIRTFGNVTLQKNQKVVITVLDDFLDEKPAKRKTARGILGQFAKTNVSDITILEKDAWKKAVEDRFN